jgi:gliding motility-associated protein GldE
LEEPDSDPHLWLLNILLDSFAGQITPDIIVSLIVILLLLFCSALISGSEVAYFSLNPTQLKDINGEDTRINRLIMKHLDMPKRLLATILITNNFVNVAIVILSAFVSGKIFEFGGNPWLGFIIEVFVITTILLLFGEILPKIFANLKPVAFASIMARPLNFLIKLFYPFSSLLVRTTRIIDKKMASATTDISMSEISEAIDITVDEETTEEETKILKGIVKFTDIEVREIMKSRMDVVSIDAEISFKELIEIVVDSGYSRIPVYTETFDNVKGILYVKDLLPHLNKKSEFNWINLLRPAFFVPENKKINDLLQEFQEKKIHLAIVVDEYGGTSGIVTLEDIIEEIIGEITDEFDTPEDEIGYRKLNANTFVFEAKTSINDFCKIVEVEDEIFDEIKGDSDSLAGIILELLGEIPEKGTTAIYRNFEFKVLSVDNRRIKQVKVIVNKQSNDEDDKN